MTPTDSGIAVAINFFTGCTQQLLAQIDQKAAAAHVDSEAWVERSKSLEQRITQQLNSAARNLRYPKQNLDRLATILSDQVFTCDTVTAFLDGRLDPTEFAKEIGAREANLRDEAGLSEIAQILLDTFTTAIAADPELARIVDLKRSEGVKRHLESIGSEVGELKGDVAKIDTKLEEQRTLLRELAERTVLSGKPAEELTSQQRYDRALAEVAAASALTVVQLREAIANFIARVRSDATASDFDRALALFAEQDYAAAETRAERAVQNADGGFQRAIDAKRQALLLLGDIQRAQLKYSAAARSYRAAYELAEQQDLVFLADAGWRLSRVLGELGRYEEAVTISKRILEVGENNFDAAGVMVALNHLGLALQQAGNYVEADPVLLRALKLWESRSQGEDLILATHIHNFSTLLRDQGRRAEAEPLARRALAIRERFLGKDHPDVATCVTHIALLLDDQGNLSEAEQLFRRALLTYEKFLPPDHPYCVTAASNLGMNLKAQGQLDAAEPLLRATVENNRRTLGGQHPRFAESLNNLGELLLARRKPDEAAKTFQSALDIQRQLYGDEHPHTQFTANNLGVAFLFQRKFSEAEEVFRATLNIKERVMPGEHLSLAKTLNNLGFVLYERRRLDEAEVFYRRALVLREQSLPSTHPEIANSLGNLGLVLHETGRHAEAETLFVRELRIREEQVPTNEEATALAMNNVAAAQYHQGKTDDAEKMLKRAVDFCRNRLGEEHELTRGALVNLSNAQIRRPVKRHDPPHPRSS
jgi:tetratricopeptide (TPR) repeat protein